MKIDNSIALMGSNKKLSINTDVDDKALKAQTDQFESLILKLLLDTSLKQDNSLFGKDPGDKIYHSLYRDELSKASAGSFGFSQMLFDHLKQNK
jgi:Rod binding domain-containing protein